MVFGIFLIGAFMAGIGGSELLVLNPKIFITVLGVYLMALACWAESRK